MFKHADDNEIHMYSHTLRGCAICAPAGMSVEQVVAGANEKFTTPNDRQYQAPKIDLFKENDKLNGKLIECTNGPARRHWILELK